MALTRSFDETVRERAGGDPAYRRALLQEAVRLFLENDHDTARLVLRDYVNATLGFEELGKRLDKSPKSLMRMLSVHGNPRTGNLFAILHVLQDHEGIDFRVESVDAA